MKNPRITQIQRKNSRDVKKMVSVIKCFICNQMFYSQPNFDEHMKLHSSKLNRNLPEQIQRKTMESFRVKKDIKVKGTKDEGTRKNMNKTTNEMKIKTEQQYEQFEDPDFNIQKQEIQQAEEVLRKSTLLIEKMESILSRGEQPQMKVIPQKKGQFTKKQKKSYPPLSQQQFIHKFLTEKQSGRQVICLMESAKFNNQFLQSCQDQLKYLTELQSFIDTESKDINKQKMEKIEQRIIQAVLQYIKQLQVEDQDFSNDSIYLTTLQNGKQNNKQEARARQIQNISPGYCNLCYSEIDYGQQCWEQDSGQQDRLNKFHIDCWQQ